MKRNNIFMWAYISFIIFSALLRMLVEFSLWTPIVLAITVSSVFFALEDLFASLYHSSKDDLDIVDSFIQEARKKYDRDMRFLTKLGKATTSYDDTNQDVVSKDLYESLKQTYDKAYDGIDSLEEGNENKRNELGTYEKAANTLAFFGFLCLFCTLIIATSLAISNIIQEILTVVPFAIILITRQLNDLMSEKNRETLNKCKSVLESQDQNNRTVTEAEELLDDLVSRIVSSEQKEATNAD